MEQPLERFRAIYQELYREKKWHQDVNGVRFAALAAISAPGSPIEVAQAIRQTSEELKKEQGLSGLPESLRLIVGAMLVLSGRNATEFHQRSRDLKKRFRTARLPRGGMLEQVAHLILFITARDGMVSDNDVSRLKEIYDEMKRYHWWLTGADDLPACAILTFQPGNPREIGARIEAIYQALNAKGFSKGDPLQTAANILFMAQASPEVLAIRNKQLYERFREKKVRIFQSDYNELAILSMLAHDPRLIVDRVLEIRQELDTFKPKVNREMSFDLAVAIVFMDLIQKDDSMNLITGTQAMLNMQAIIAAQQAAVMVAIGASVAASTAASSAGG